MAEYIRGTARSTASINDELEKIQNSLADKLDRKPSSGQPNEMVTDLDMNGNRVYNLPEPLSNTEPTTKEYVDTIATSGIPVNLGTDKVFENIANAKGDLTLEIGDTVRVLGHYNVNDGGDACYVVVTSGTGVDNGGSYHDTLNGLQLQLLDKEPSIEVFGAVLDGVADVTQQFINWIKYSRKCVLSKGTYFFDDNYLSTLPNKRVDIPANTYIEGDRETCIFKTNIQTGVSDPSTNRVLFYMDGVNASFNGWSFDGTGADLEKVLTCGINAVNPVVKNVRIQNMFCSRFLWAITINARIKNYKIDDVEFINLEVTPSGIEGEQLGSLRGIYVGYSEVGGDPGANLGFGDIHNISGENLTPYEDTDLIQCISNSGSAPFSHYSPINIKNIRAKNVGKRVVKCQLNGATVEDVYADATNITHAFGYMFAIVAALNGSNTVRNVRGKGKFKTGIECKDETFIEDVYIISDYGSGDVPSGTHTLILNEGGKTSRSSLTLSTLRTSGYWRSLLLNRENGYGDTSKISIDNLYTENSTVDYSIGIFAVGQVNPIETVDINDCTLGTLSAGDPAIVTTSDDAGVQKISKVNLSNITIIGSNSNPVSVDIRSDRASLTNISDNTNNDNIVQAVCPSGVVLENIREESGVVQAKRLANLSGCNNSLVRGCYSPTANTQAVRVSGGNNCLVVNNALAVGIFPYTAVSGATNVQEFNNYSFA